jgi:hypothetical protein
MGRAAAWRSNLGSSRSVPMPEDGVTPLVGDYLLVKPSISGWDYVQVTSVIGTEIEVKDAYGESRKIKRGEFSGAEIIN